MIITIIALAMVIIGIIILSIGIDSDAVNTLGFLICVFGSIITIVAVWLIITAHVGVNAAVEENRIVYESLCERNEVISSDYEDVSRSEVIKDVAEWNKIMQEAVADGTIPECTLNRSDLNLVTNVANDLNEAFHLRPSVASMKPDQATLAIFQDQLTEPEKAKMENIAQKNLILRSKKSSTTSEFTLMKQRSLRQKPI